MQFSSGPKTTAEHPPEPGLDAQELTDENLEEASGGAAAVPPVWAKALPDAALVEGEFTGRDLLR